MAIAFFVVFPPGELIARFADMSSDKVSADARPLIWRQTLSLIAEYPWFGVGLGGYEATFLKHQAVAAAFNIQFAHNDYLQYLAELGLVGFSILLTALIAVLAPVVRKLRGLQDGDNRLVMVACLGSFAAIALHSLVDFNTYVPANSMTLAWIMGVASASGMPGIATSKSRPVTG